MRFLLCALLLGCTADPPPAAPQITPNPAGLQCGAVDIPCNCNGALVYNWKISPTAKCRSGRHQWYQCQSTCLGGAWESACYCDGVKDANR